MDYRSNYVPKNKKKANYKIVVPFILLIGLFIYGIYRLIQPSNEAESSHFVACNMSRDETLKAVESVEIGNFTNLADYGSYGQTLGLYGESYNILETDPFSGKTVFMNNICKKEESVYMMNVELDNKIPMEVLEVGFYHVKVLDGLKPVSLRTQDPIDQSFYTVAKDGYRKRVRLLSNAALFTHDEHSVFDGNYLFIEVTSVPVESNTYDIILDPAGLTENEYGVLDVGATRDGFKESDLMYDVAEGVKKNLESYGLRVKIVRDKKEPKNTFGIEGRIDDAYKLEAKYYINLRFPNKMYPSDKGTTILYSNHTSNKFATNIMKQFKEQTGLVGSNWTTGKNLSGVYETGYDEGFDTNDVLRETGGKFTGSGQYDEVFKSLNQIHSESSNGMHAVVIELGFMDEDVSFKTVTTEVSGIAQAIANGIMIELGFK